MPQRDAFSELFSEEITVGAMLFDESWLEVSVPSEKVTPSRSVISVSAVEASSWPELNSTLSKFMRVSWEIPFNGVIAIKKSQLKAIKAFLKLNINDC